MRSIQALVVPLALAILVSPNFGQEAETKVDDKDLAKAVKMLHGTWAGDAEKTAEEIKKMKDLDLDEGMLDMVLEQVGSIEATFKVGTYDVVIAEQEMFGKWKATKAKTKDESIILTVNVIPDEESGGEEKNFEIHFMGKTHMKMIDLDQGGPPIVMKREAKEKKDK